MGSKTQRQNQHVRRLAAKVKRHKAKGRDTSKMEKELEYCAGEDRPAFKSGKDVDKRFKKRR